MLLTKQNKKRNWNWVKSFVSCGQTGLNLWLQSYLGGIIWLESSWSLILKQTQYLNMLQTPVSPPNVWHIKSPPYISLPSIHFTSNKKVIAIKISCRDKVWRYVLGYKVFWIDVEFRDAFFHWKSICSVGVSVVLHAWIVLWTGFSFIKWH